MWVKLRKLWNLPERKLFLIEAMWSRFLPMIKKIHSLLDEGIIGEIKVLNADFGFRSDWNAESRLFNAKLAGGAILDVGVYTISFASSILGCHPSKIVGVSNLGQTGVDEQTGIVMGYDSGQLAMLSCAVRTNTMNEAHIIGTEGYINIPYFWKAKEATICISYGNTRFIDMHFDGMGYSFEAQEVMDCIREGKLESNIMPLEESISIMEIMDEVRKQVGVRYPNEK